jgi:hypothetical protein
VATVAVSLSREAQTQFVDSGGLRDVRQTLAETSRLVAQLTRISAEQSRQLTLTQQQVRRTLAAVDSAKVDSTVSNLRATSANVTALTDSLRITTARVNATLGPAADRAGHRGQAAHRLPALPRRALARHAHRLAHGRLPEAAAQVHQPRDLLARRVWGARGKPRAGARAFRS